MRWSKIIEDSTLTQTRNIFKFNVTAEKKKDDGTTILYNYVVDIPDLITSIMVGERVVIDLIEKQYLLAVESGSLNSFYTGLVLMIQGIANNFKYKWVALLESNELYFNPLWNIDGSETVTRDYGIDKTTFTGGAQTNTTQHGQQQNTMVYGQDQQSMQYGQETNSLQHGGATDSVQYGAHETEETHKTNPFNDTEHLYSTGEDVTNSKTHTDTTTRGTYTDTETRNTKTDTQTRNTHTDTNTLATYTDTDTIGAKTDSNTRDARKDTETTERHGNIGVTKSTELLSSYRELPTEYYKPFLMDLMSYLSYGY